MTDQVHVKTAAWLRKQYRQPLRTAAGDGPYLDLHRDLADYDHAFGLNSEEA